MRLAVLVCFVVVAVGCGGPNHDLAVRTRASSELECPAPEIQVVAMGAGGYRASGCGQTATYSCITQPRAWSSRIDVVCAREAGGETSGGRAASPPPPWSDWDVQELLRRAHDDIVACLPSEMPELELRLDLTSAGRVRRLEPQLAAQVGGCIDARLAAERRSAPRQARTVVLRFRRREDPATAQADPAPPPAVAEPAGSDAAAAARAAVDSRARAILACTGEDAMAIQISWAGDGRLDAALRGALAGSAEESCVRGIVQQLRIPGSGAAGEILHAIQR